MVDQTPASKELDRLLTDFGRLCAKNWVSTDFQFTAPIIAVRAAIHAHVDRLRCAPAAPAEPIPPGATLLQVRRGKHGGGWFDATQDEFDEAADWSRRALVLASPAPAPEARNVTAEEDGVLRRAALRAGTIVAKGRAPAPEAATPQSDDALLREVLDVMILANSSHAVTLLSDPPQDAWKYYGTSVKLITAIAKVRARLKK